MMESDLGDTILPSSAAFPQPLPDFSRGRGSRDEMNLAEFPLTVLSTRASPALKTLEFTDTIRTKQGEVVERRWIITGADKFGLPTASDDEVLLGLLKLTVDDGFKDRKVYFTRYELLRILRWSTEGRSYQRLQRALDRLSGVRIKASNAFFDNESKSHSTRNFGIIDAYEINDGRTTEPKPSFFAWSEVMFKSFQVGFIKKIDLDFYLDLQSAVSKRLYRFLDKHFWYRAQLQMNVFTLAHEKIGISRNYQFVSLIRQQIDPALEELQQAGFIASFEYLGKGKGAEIIIRSRDLKPRSIAKQPGDAQPRPAESRLSASAAASGVSLHTGPAPLREELRQLLVARGLRPKQVDALLMAKEDASLPRLRRIVEHFDRLMAENSRLVSRSPVGFLYRAVENAETFVLPGEGQSSGGTLQRSLDLPIRQTTPASSGARQETAALEAQYLTERKREAMRLRSEVEQEVLSRITREVEDGLAKLRGIISPDRFREAVVHGVEEKLVRLFAFPDFSDWLRSRKGTLRK